jgi:hypothetical protein
MDKNKIDKIKHRELAIYAEIRFEPENQKRLEEIMKQVSQDGDTDFLYKRHRFFSYCIQRNAWYGSENDTWLPYCYLDELIA